MAKKSASKTKTATKTVSTKTKSNFKPDMEDIEIMMQFEGRDVVKN